METKIYKSYEDFLKRADKNTNGVSEDFAAKHPDFEKQNESNEGCWNCSSCVSCYNCASCKNCNSCYYCELCNFCEYCYYCDYSEHCTSCSHCKFCENCENLIKNKNKQFKTKTKTMKAKDLTSQQRIMILEDVLRNLESGDTEYGLCDKITRSTFELFDISDIWEIPSKNIIPFLTLENAIKVTDVVNWAFEGSYWWDYSGSYDFENRIKFVKWMIEMEKLTLKVMQFCAQANI